jgi:hypothetical protein
MREMVRGMEFVIEKDGLAICGKIYKAPFRAIYLGFNPFGHYEFVTIDENEFTGQHDFFSLENRDSVI